MTRWLAILSFFVLMMGLWRILLFDVKVPTQPKQPPAVPTTELGWQDFFIKDLLPLLPIADQFETPLRPPRGEGVWVARPFAKDGHLGEDWNVAYGDQDLGEPVYSPADGWVSVAVDFQSMWGKVVEVIYRLPKGAKPEAVEMLFGHLSELEVKPMTFVKKGQILGRMGNADGVYKAHLHWEVRIRLDLGLGGGYSDSTDGWISPSQFLQAQHPETTGFLRGQNLLESTWAAWGSD